MFDRALALSAFSCVFKVPVVEPVLFLNWFVLARFLPYATACIAAPSTDFPISFGRRIVVGRRILLVRPLGGGSIVLFLSVSCLGRASVFRGDGCVLFLVVASTKPGVRFPSDRRCSKFEARLVSIRLDA